MWTINDFWLYGTSDIRWHSLRKALKLSLFWLQSIEMSVHSDDEMFLNAKSNIVCIAMSFSIFKIKWVFCENLSRKLITPMVEGRGESVRLSTNCSIVQTSYDTFKRVYNNSIIVVLNLCLQSIVNAIKIEFTFQL